MEQITELIHNPLPKNWLNYATAMPPIQNAAKEDEKIKKWIIPLVDIKE